MQCLRRYRDTGGEVRHLLNFGKYVFSLIVVIVSWSRSTRLLIVVSTLATVYAWTWDVTLDWGLGPQDFCGSTTRASQESHAKVDVEDGEDGPQKLKRNPARRQTKTREKNPERQFPKRVYWLCAVVDLAGRFSWVLTLMPISLVTTNLVVRVVLVSIISSIEILRRSMWAVLRIEFEQVANASGFRALLWVPSKLNKPEDGGPSKGAAGAPVQPVQPRSGSTLSNLKLPAPVGVGGLQQPLLIQ
ncbi:unnamed protein product [Polarella glacialis]|uniref:EXS domain-containing protein n=1 Tax=Polarella glacialis TaxID=89957 RepID=A0A813EGI7_POLGL|nr:unnamed protein product [Polarella glacialis]